MKTQLGKKIVHLMKASFENKGETKTFSIPKLRNAVIQANGVVLEVSICIMLIVM